MLFKIPFLPWTGKTDLEVEIGAEFENASHEVKLGAAVKVAFKGGANLARANLYGANLARADLYGANLYGASLVRADLYGANLDGANLVGANLARASLASASLVGASLASASLVGADLDGADLDGANLMEGVKLVGRGIIQIGPIGSRGDRMVAFFTNNGVYVQAGCFFDTLDVFAAKVEKTHGSNDHGTAYRAAIALIEVMRPNECPAESRPKAAE